MGAIVTGRFEAEQQAARAIDKLLGSCVSCDHVRTFFLTPSERQADFELEVGPAAAAGGVEVTAYMGSLGADVGGAGATAKQKSAEILVAVETPDSVSQVLAANVLREHGARGVERAAKPPQDESWPGLDPVPLSSLIRL